MRRLFTVIGRAVVLGALACAATAGTLFTNPVIYVTPMKLDFKAVQRGTTATNTFVVENMGVGVLKGVAKVRAPFHVIAGGEYALHENEAQIVTVTYKPSGSPRDTKTCKFTGGGGASAIVTGRITDEPPKKPRRR